MAELAVAQPIKIRSRQQRGSNQVANGRLAVHVTDDNGVHGVSQYLAFTPFRRLLKDYIRICESYYDAIRRPGPEYLEAIDMGRRVSTTRRPSC